MAPEYQSSWRQRASDARARGKKTSDAGMREDLLAIAKTCERLVQLSTPQADASKPPASHRWPTSAVP